MNYQQLFRRFEGLGLLLLSDRSLPSVAGMIGGPGIKGSWWGHEKGHEIFREAERLEAHPDSLTTRLVSGKVTYLHRRLWPDFLSVATAREGWQTKGLSSRARSLLALVEREGEIRMDKRFEGRAAQQYRQAAREIERRLLVYTAEVHTERGAHAKVLMTWSMSPKLRGQRFQPRSPASEKKTLEKVVRELNRKFGGHGQLPWRQ